MNDVRDADRFPESAVSAGELFAAGIIEEVLRAMVTVYSEQTDPELLGNALDHLDGQLGEDELQGLLADFAGAFPPLAVINELMTAIQYLDAATEGIPHRQVTLEELLMLRLGNENPANVRFRELFDDAPLEVRESYEQAVKALESFFEGLEPIDGGGEGGPASLFELLRAPVAASPTSLEGQLRYIRENWADLLGDRFPGLL
ncbi:MAG: alpha-amylase, partial [Acidimicrobiia bacterium]|nr:alpha-amylase [Acidimicrobiia bacterium]